LVRRWLAGEDEFPARLLDGFGDGLAGEQIVAEKDRPERLHGRAVTDMPTFAALRSQSCFSAPS